MIAQLKEHLGDNNCTYIPIPSQYIPNIHNLFFKDIVNPVHDGTVLLYYGAYYHIKQNHELTISYFKMAIKCGNSHAMWNLATHHRNNHAKYVKYLLMAIEYKYPKAMLYLAAHYENIYQFDNAIKYYLMAVDHGNTTAMNNLAFHYKHRGNYELAMKYWLLEFNHSHMTQVSYILNICKIYGLKQWGILWCNKVPNNECSSIMEYIMHFVNEMNADMVNIIINMDMAEPDPLLDSIKDLVIY